MRVLHVVEAIEAGVARHVSDLVAHVAAEHELLVPPERVGGFTDLAALEAIEAAGARVHLTPMRRSPLAAANAVAGLRARRLIRRSRPDVVHGHAGVGGALARLAAAGGGPPCAYTAHALLPGRAALTAERLLGRLTDRFVALSATEAELAERLGIAPRERIAVIPNGIDLRQPGPPAADLRARLGVGAEAVLVGTVGRLAPQKAPEVFIRACGRIAAASPEARFVLIGDGPLRDRVGLEVERAGLAGRLLHIPGLLGAATVLPQLDVFVLASRYEAAPYAPLEAMRAGVPVVATDVVGSRDTVVDEVTGVTTPAGDPEAIAAAVDRLLADVELRRRLVAAAGERLRADFGVGAMAARTGGLYAELAGGRR